MSEFDQVTADRLNDECRTGDVEADGCHADKIIIAAMRAIGLAKTADAYEDLDLWRA